MNIEKLQKISKMNLTTLCKDAGLNVNSVRAKIKHNRELKVNEAEVIILALSKFGLKIKE